MDRYLPRQGGDLANSGVCNALFQKYVQQVQETTDLGDESKKVDYTYSLNRTLRRTLQTRLTRAGMSAAGQESMNRWRKVENAKGKRPRFNMRQLYAEACLQMPTCYLAVILCDVSVAKATSAMGLQHANY